MQSPRPALTFPWLKLRPTIPLLEIHAMVVPSLPPDPAVRVTVLLAILSFEPHYLQPGLPLPRNTARSVASSPGMVGTFFFDLENATYSDVSAFLTTRLPPSTLR